MNLSGCAKFLFGFVLAILLLIGGVTLASVYFMAKLTQPPPKPIFANDPEAKTSPALQTPTAKPSPQKNPSSSPSPSASPSPTPNPDSLKPGTYKARVTWPNGLVLRSNPSINAERVGGLANNTPIIVLEQSTDKKWQRIRTENGNREGWIKAGNIKKLED